MKIKTRSLVITISILIVLVFLVSYLVSIETQSNIYRIILKADIDLSEISIDSQQAESYYAEANYAYEDGDYKEVERNCRLARDYYFEEGQGYKRIKAELNKGNWNDELIILYIEKLDLLSKITNNMYEACEYLESAARYYDSDNYYMGGEEIDMMNEKILAHDDTVEKYNNKLAEFKIELENRIKK